MYYPHSWNPVNMITYTLAHANWGHLTWNMIYFVAFAPVLEILIGSKLRYIWIMMFIGIVTSICYSISVMMGDNQNIPTLGFSGVVTGMIGLSAYLMPKARIKVFWWYVFAWKIFYVRAWILAVFYIGGDTWTMLNASSYGGINVVTHVAGGFAGYFYAYFWLKGRKEEVKNELAYEIKVMGVNTGKTEVVKNLLSNSRKRYGSLLKSDQCNHLLQKVS